MDRTSQPQSTAVSVAKKRFQSKWASRQRQTRRAAMTAVTIRKTKVVFLKLFCTWADSKTVCPTRVSSGYRSALQCRSWILANFLSQGFVIDSEGDRKPKWPVPRRLPQFHEPSGRGRNGDRTEARPAHTTGSQLWMPTPASWSG